MYIHVHVNVPDTSSPYITSPPTQMFPHVFTMHILTCFHKRAVSTQNVALLTWIGPLLTHTRLLFIYRLLFIWHRPRRGCFHMFSQQMFSLVFTRGLFSHRIWLFLHGKASSYTEQVSFRMASPPTRMFPHIFTMDVLHKFSRGGFFPHRIWLISHGIGLFLHRTAFVSHMFTVDVLHKFSRGAFFSHRVWLVSREIRLCLHRTAFFSHIFTMDVCTSAHMGAVFT